MVFKGWAIVSSLRSEAEAGSLAANVIARWRFASAGPPGSASPDISVFLVACLTSGSCEDFAGVDRIGG